MDLSQEDLECSHREQIAGTRCEPELAKVSTQHEGSREGNRVAVVNR
jgi:hypothetical protein